MIVRNNKNKPQTPFERLTVEKKLFSEAQTEKEISSENFAEQVAELICENAVCIVDNKDKVITVKLFNGQIFKLTAEKLK